jgi:hypothetical protein
LEVARSRRERGFEAWALRLRGEIEARSTSSDTEAAEQSYRLALGLAGDLAMRPLVAHCHFGLGQLFQRAGKPTTEDHLRVAASMYREMDMRPPAPGAA